MFWTDSGTVPRIESSWMDGTRRKVIVGDRLETPTGITVDYASGHRLYWSDSKANSIESSRTDGSDRIVVLKGDLLHPISIDVFEDQLYWVTRDSGEIFRQDKFGRGVKVRVRRSLEHATDVKIFQTQKYNTSRKFKCSWQSTGVYLTCSSSSFVSVAELSPCRSNPCSHLCLVVPRGYRCACPDGQTPDDIAGRCETAAFEAPKPQLYRCHCKNGGACAQKDDNSNDIICRCRPNFEGSDCGEYIARSRVFPGSSTANTVVSIFIVLVVMILASVLYLFFKKKNM